QPAEIDGQRVLLVGARSGIMVVNPEKPSEPQLYNDPELVSQMGFSRAVIWRNGLWACHGDAGVVGWDLGALDRPKTVLRPAHLPAAMPTTASSSGTSIEITQEGGVRSSVVLFAA